MINKNTNNKKILITSLLRNNEEYIPYMNKMLNNIEEKNKNFDFEYLFYTNNNTDNTKTLLEEHKKYNIISEDFGEEFLKEKRRTVKLAIFRQKLLEASKKKEFDYLLIFDTDLYFNGSMINSAFEKIIKKNLEVTCFNSIGGSIPMFYDWLAYNKELTGKKSLKAILSIIKKIYTDRLVYKSIISNEICETNSFFNGIMIFKNTSNFREKINYIEENEDLINCEHHILCNKLTKENIKISVLTDITPLYSEIESIDIKKESGKVDHKNYFSKINNNKNDFREKKYIYFSLIYILPLVLIIFLITKLFFWIRKIILFS